MGKCFTAALIAAILGMDNYEVDTVELEFSSHLWDWHR